MKNTKIRTIVLVGLAMVFAFPLIARAKKPLAAGGGGEPMTGGLPALEDRVEADEAIIATLVANSLQRLSAEFQSGGEIATIATPAASPTPGAPGGVVVYDKTLSIPAGVAYITFSAQGDTHEQIDGVGALIPGTVAALLMSASITDAGGNATVCQPMATAGGAAAFGAPWMTLIKLPDGETGPNGCNDGSGGPQDCHDNAFSFSCCALLSAGPAGNNSRDVKINLASSNGGTVFYEDSTIYIDYGTNAALCAGVGTAPH